jgi:electron transfer flavoprotein beta subunit
VAKSLNIIVLVKQVPEIEKVRFDHEKGRLDRSSAGTVINPFDLNALEAAVQIKERIGGTVTALNMGPSNAEEALKDAIARGADKAILLTDQRFAGADTLATSYTLASAIKRLAMFDLIVCGEKTIDGDTAQVGPEIAEFLDIPHIAYVEEVTSINKERITVKSRMDQYYCVTETRFPCLITVTKDINTPRLPTLKDKLRSMKVTITIWNTEDLSTNAQEGLFGLSGSPTWVAKVYSPINAQKKGHIIRGTPEEIAREIMQVLAGLNVAG